MKYTAEKTMQGFFARRFYELYGRKGKLELNSDVNSAEEISRTTLLPFLLLDIAYNDISTTDKNKYHHRTKQCLNKVIAHTDSLWKDFWIDYKDVSDTSDYIFGLMDSLEKELKQDYTLLNLCIMKNFQDIDDLEAKKDICKVEVYAIFLQMANEMFKKILKKPLFMLTRLEKEASSLGNHIYCDYTEDNKKNILLNEDNDIVILVRKIIDKTMAFIETKNK